MVPNKKKSIIITDLDKKIINILQENSRLSCRDIAKEVKVSAVTVMKRIKFLQDNKIIKKFGIWIDHEKLGYDICVLVQLKLTRENLEKTETRIAKHPNILRVYDITGPFDCMIVAKFRSRRQLDNFIKKLRTYDGVVRTETILVFNIYKEGSIEIE
jgi:Lrp/AsnC family transcriptional regulator, regulator for asnA, asnC and gidA